MTSDQSTLLPIAQAKTTSARKWAKENQMDFLELMIEKVIERGKNLAIETFSRGELADIRIKFYERFGLKHSVSDFKFKLWVLKLRYEDHEKLLDEQQRTGVDWDPVLCIVIASPEWWNNYIKRNPRARLFQWNGCPEHEKLQMLFGNTVATEHSIEIHYHDVNSTNVEDSNRKDPYKASEGESGDPIRRRSRSPRAGTRRGRGDNIVSEINESLKVLAAYYKTKIDEKNKYTMTECMEILDGMVPEVGRGEYMRALKLLQERKWREVFIHMSDRRRKAGLSALQMEPFRYIDISQSRKLFATAI